ncbi:hypothetical protein FAVG1_10245 [Fusarium avenaceum]|nr:hypothetical protein FAVG1_10245 [Fusarium avenaceum]
MSGASYALETAYSDGLILWQDSQFQSCLSDKSKLTPTADKNASWNITSGALSLAVCLLSAQARFALAGPCRPLTTTSVGATTTIATSKEVSTTATLTEEPTTTIEGETSTVVVSDVPTTTTTLSEELTTTTAAETNTAVETTTAAGTTTAAETTTTTLAPEPSLYAQYADGTEIGVYLDSSNFVGTEADDLIKADFALETDTSRLYVTLSDGSKLYAVTVIPTGDNFSFVFYTYGRVTQYPDLYHFTTCTTDSELYLTCSSEGGPTRIYWYKPSNSIYFYGNSDLDVGDSFGNMAARFRLPRRL